MRVVVMLRSLNGEADPTGIRLKGFASDVFIELRGDLRARSQRRAKVQAVAQMPAGRPATARKPEP